MLPFNAHAVGTLVPVVFEAYGRVFHPAEGSDGEAIRWEEVAAWAGREMHGRAQFDWIASPSGPLSGQPPFTERPTPGDLPRATLSALIKVLGIHTGTPLECFMGIWEGRGWIQEVGVDHARLELPERVHVMFEGPIANAMNVGWRFPSGPIVHEAPSVMWPTDRAWFVATDVDLDSTYVGGTAALLDALMHDDQLEVWRVAPEDSVTWASDEINSPSRDPNPQRRSHQP